MRTAPKVIVRHRDTSKRAVRTTISRIIEDLLFYGLLFKNIVQSKTKERLRNEYTYFSC